MDRIIASSRQTPDLSLFPWAEGLRDLGINTVWAKRRLGLDVRAEGSSTGYCYLNPASLDVAELEVNDSFSDPSLELGYIAGYSGSIVPRMPEHSIINSQEDEARREQIIQAVIEEYKAHLGLRFSGGLHRKYWDGDYDFNLVYFRSPLNTRCGPEFFSYDYDNLVTINFGAVKSFTNIRRALNRTSP